MKKLPYILFLFISKNMKRRYSLLLFAVLISNNILSQTNDPKVQTIIEKRSIICGLDFGFNYQRSDNQFIYSNTLNTKSKTTTTTLSLATNVGYFIKNWLMSGIEIEYISSNSKTQSNQNISYYTPQRTLFSTGLFSPVFRFYIIQGLYTQVDISYGFTKYYVEYNDLPLGTEDYSEDVIKEVYGGGLGLGYSFLINQNIIIEPKLSYKKLNYKDDIIIDTDNLIFKIGFKILL